MIDFKRIYGECKVKDNMNKGQEALMNTGLYAIGPYCIVASPNSHYKRFLKQCNMVESLTKGGIGERN